MSWETELPAALAAWLKERGIPALAGWTGTRRGEMTAPIVVVTVREYSACSGGFADYLGERYNEETAAWEELYGKKVEAVLGLDLYAPERGSEEQLQALLEQIVRVLTLDSPEGLQVGELSCGATKWDEQQRRLTREVSVQCVLWLQAVCTGIGEFLDFELRGGWKL